MTPSDRDLTVDLGGVTLTGSLNSVDGFRGYEANACIGAGQAVWDFASSEVLRWGVKTRSGFTVTTEAGGASQDTAAAGERYWLTAHLGSLRVREPVQVVAVVNQVDRAGFAYGTLTGHPVSGEEAFIVDRRHDDSVWLTNRSLTGPPTGPWLVMYPLALVAQRYYRRRYLRSLG